MTKEELRIQWKTRVDDFKLSGKTMNKYCTDNDLKPHQLKYWCEKYKDVIEEKELPTQWVPIHLDPQSKESSSIKSVKDDVFKITVGKCSVEVTPGFDTVSLTEVIKVLISLC